MEVSTFELLYKPLVPQLNPALTAVGRRVLQAYFLTITNLEDTDYFYRLEYRISLPSPDDPTRRLDGGLLVVNIANDPPAFSSVTRVGATNRYAGIVTIPAGKTAQVGLFPPNLTLPTFFQTSTPFFEVRGHARITLPRRRLFQAQSDHPVKVLLNPEQRATFLPNDFPAMTSGLDFDQTNTSLTIASGQGLNEIPPDPPIFITTVADGILAAARLQTPGGMSQTMFDEPEEQLATLIELLARVQPDDENVAGLGRLLAEAGVPLTVSRRADPPARPRTGK